MNGWADPGRYTRLLFGYPAAVQSARVRGQRVPPVQNPLPGQDQLGIPCSRGSLCGSPTSSSARRKWRSLVLLHQRDHAGGLSDCRCDRHSPYREAPPVGRSDGGARAGNHPLRHHQLGPACGGAHCGRDVALGTQVPDVGGSRDRRRGSSQVLPVVAPRPASSVVLARGPYDCVLEASRGAIAGWLVCNVPFMLINFDGWAHFYRFSSERGEGLPGRCGSCSRTSASRCPPSALNKVATGIFLIPASELRCWHCEQRGAHGSPSWRSLVVAAFLVTNKVYSPQYVLWLIPLAAMARPRWRDFLIWQVGQVIYLSPCGSTSSATATTTRPCRSAGTAPRSLFRSPRRSSSAVMVIRDVLNPSHDPVRTDAFADDRDDPGEAFSMVRRPTAATRLPSMRVAGSDAADEAATV